MIDIELLGLHTYTECMHEKLHAQTPHVRSEIKRISAQPSPIFSQNATKKLGHGYE